ncbi:MAG TPA: hypothetical protein VMJ75_18570 [Candidatus Acidoferrales bacterium]|nr:hypothetical protein [Candidatus Acidoferrales bacterium]HXK04994.1 hypothetical protein [Verrucomicrobiae bacterium]
MESSGRERRFRIAHGWQASAAAEVSPALIRDFIRPAVRAIPSDMVRQLGPCRVSIVNDLGSPSVASRWTLSGARIEISLATAGRDHHDIALELLVCLGQALWERLSDLQRKAYWGLLDDETRAGVPGEIDEEALKQKRLLFSSRHSAASRRRLERYGSASLAGTAAEYIHSLWHDVRVRTGVRFLPAEQLRRRLELLAQWYPPGRGYRLFPPPSPKR